jgi:hypothetical protein
VSVLLLSCADLYLYNGYNPTTCRRRRCSSKKDGGRVQRDGPSISQCQNYKQYYEIVVLRGHARLTPDVSNWKAASVVRVYRSTFQSWSLGLTWSSMPIADKCCCDNSYISSTVLWETRKCQTDTPTRELCLILLIYSDYVAKETCDRTGKKTLAQLMKGRHKNILRSAQLSFPKICHGLMSHEIC